MEMFFLIIKLGYGSVVMPDKYSHEQCIKAGKFSENIYVCVPAPPNCAYAKDLGNGKSTAVFDFCYPTTGK